MRGLTAIKRVGGKEHLLGAREQPGVIERIDPFANFTATEEFNIRRYFTDLWGGLGGSATIAGYNNMPFFTHPDTGETVRLIGLWVNHPDDQSPMGKGSYYLVRNTAGKYVHGVILDPSFSATSSPLLGTRTIVVSPFKEDKGRVLYFGGFDAGGPGFSKQDTGWIFRAQVPKGRVQRRSRR